VSPSPESSVPPWLAAGGGAVPEKNAVVVQQQDLELDIELPASYQLHDLLVAVMQHGASDLHLSVGLPPMLRVHGLMHRAKAPALTQAHAEAMLLPIVDQEHIERYRATGGVDFAYSFREHARFRGNYFDHYRGMGAVFRLIPSDIPSLDELGMPHVLKEIASLRAGFVVVTGPTGSGKSTTLAAMINHVNETRNAHIITIEDPIEFFHPRKSCLIDHREIGMHARSFSDALQAALREDPDIILVGEMRDLDTIYNAIKAAETGALVFATLHTNTAAKTVDRLVDVFPGRQQEQIRSMLAESLKDVVAQQLVLRADGTGRVAAHEIMLWSPGLSNLIRESKSSQIPNYIHTGRHLGMQTLDGRLHQLVQQGIVAEETALERCLDPANFHNAG